MANNGYTLYNYIDDVIGFEASENADQAFHTLKALFHYLGLPVNPDELEPPTQTLVCMGIEIDIKQGII